MADPHRRRTARLLVRAVPALIAGIVLSVPHGRAATRLVPDDYSTIQGAIDACISGDTVLIGPGTYHGTGNKNIEFRGRDLVVKSRAGRESTIIDCEASGRGFYLHEFETRAAVIQGLTILNGNNPSGIGGGIACAGASPTISDCRVSNCRAFRGAGLDLPVFYGIVDRCIISGNYATDQGGGVYLGWAVFQTMEITNCLITGNRAGRAAGVCFGGSGPNSLSGCTVASNRSDTEGGGVWATTPLLLEKCIVWGNCAVTSGQDIRCLDADIRCSDIDMSGVYGLGEVVYDESCVDVNPAFCGGTACGLHTTGDWSLNATSICLPEQSPCGELIGALGVGCGAPTPTGACCFANGSCLLLDGSECVDLQGIFMGGQTSCDVDPCQPTPARSRTWGQIKASFR